MARRPEKWRAVKQQRVAAEHDRSPVDSEPAEREPQLVGRAVEAQRLRRRAAGNHQHQHHDAIHVRDH
jgi:hypothetical protein